MDLAQDLAATLLKDSLELGVALALLLRLVRPCAHDSLHTYRSNRRFPLTIGFIPKQTECQPTRGGMDRNACIAVPFPFARVSNVSPLTRPGVSIRRSTGNGTLPACWLIPVAMSRLRRTYRRN